MKKFLIAVLIVVHLAASFWHGSLHKTLSVNLSSAQSLFVLTVIIIAPVVAGGLIWTRLHTIGLWLFSLSMLGAFLFGGFYHYILVSPDNIHFLPAGSPEAGHQFKLSAGVIALLELASALFGVFCLGARSLRRANS